MFPDANIAQALDGKRSGSPASYELLGPYRSIQVPVLGKLAPRHYRYV
jgi:hypothetical protein